MFVVILLRSQLVFDDERVTAREVRHCGGVEVSAYRNRNTCMCMILYEGGSSEFVWAPCTQLKKANERTFCAEFFLSYYLLIIYVDTTSQHQRTTSLCENVMLAFTVA
jgi:hypothetical protein